MVVIRAKFFAIGSPYFQQFVWDLGGASLGASLVRHQHVPPATGAIVQLGEDDIVHHDGAIVVVQSWWCSRGAVMVQ